MSKTLGRFVAVYLSVRSGCVAQPAVAQNSFLVFHVWPEEKTCVVTNVPLEGTPSAKMVLFARKQDGAGTGHASFTVSQLRQD